MAILKRAAVLENKVEKTIEEFRKEFPTVWVARRI